MHNMNIGRGWSSSSSINTYEGSRDCWIYRWPRDNVTNWNILLTGEQESKSDSCSSAKRNGELRILDCTFDVRICICTIIRMMIL